MAFALRGYVEQNASDLVVLCAKHHPVLYTGVTPKTYAAKLISTTVQECMWVQECMRVLTLGWFTNNRQEQNASVVH